MAQKVIAIKIDVQGTADQKKKIVGLELTLKKLTDQQKRLKKQVKDGVITNDQYAKSIAKVNLGLKGTRRQLLVTRQEMLGIDGFTTRLGKSFRKFGTSVSGAFVGLFAAQKLFQIMSDGVQTIKDFEQQMATVKAITGATTEEFNKLEKSAKDLGSSTQFTASQVGKLQEEYAKLGFNTQEILDASEATLDLATATGSDLAQSAKVAAATINGFGLEAKDTQKIVDIMAKSFTNSALDISKFETAMASVAPVAATVGFSIEQTTASLGTLTDAGFDASTAGTALRNILLDTQKAGLTTSEAFEKIRNSLDPAATALDLFGKRGAAVAITLANNEEKTKAFATSLEDAAGSAKQMAAVVGDTLEGDIKRLTSAFEGLILGSSGTEFFRDITQGATDLLNTLSDLTNNTHEESDALEEQRIAINVLVGRITDLNEGTDERKILIEELNRISPKFLDGLDRENLSNKILAKRLKEVNEQLVNQIILKKSTEKIEEQGEKVANARIKQLAAETKIRKEFIKQEASIRKTEKLREKRVKSFKGTFGEQREINALKETRKQLAIINNESLTVIEKVQQINRIQAKTRTSRSLFGDDLPNIIDQFNKATRVLKAEGDILSKLSEDKEALKIRLKVNEVNEEEVKTKKDIIVVNNELLKSEEELADDKLKADKKLKEEIERADKRLAKNTLKNNQETLILEIENKQKAEDKKLEIERLNAVNSIKLGEGTAEAKRLAIESVNAKFDAKESALERSRADKKKADAKIITDEENKKKEAKAAKAEQKLKNDKKKQDLIDAENRKIKNQGAVDVANELATTLTNIEQQKADREKDIALASLDAELQGGLISQQQFEAKKLAIEKKAFEKKKKLEIANVVISLATEIASIAANSAGNPLNAFTSGVAGAAQNKILAGIAIARSAVQVGAIASQKFSDGGFTGNGSGIADETGFKQAGIVHEGEYVVPKHVLGTSEGSSLVGALENMRTNKPMPNLGIGYANGGMVSSGNLDLQGLENRMTKAISNSLSNIQVTNVATETTSQAIKVNNIEQEASFG